ncbi:MAG: hypothetical protein DRR19_14690 [Candidatus Parabeggiatoa sp. nov. 1]|nr:MAG: hypothetical protein DRR19_14690 [Gammaproteobacteria bacterium]
MDIHLEGNQLTGPIPDFSALPNLVNLSVEANQLTGTIPNFSALPNLSGFSLYDNQLTGPIPDFGATPNLQRLWLYNSQINQLCKDTNITYSTGQFAKLSPTSIWEEQLNGLPNCNQPPKCTQAEIDTADGLVAYYPFEGDTQDASGNEHHGVEQGGSLNYVAGKIGQAARFDGNTYVEISSDPSLVIDGQITISAWVKLDGYSKYGYGILQKGTAWMIWDYGLASHNSYPAYRSSANDWIIEETRHQGASYGEFHFFTVVVNESSETDPVVWYLDGNRIVGKLNSLDNLEISVDDDWIRQTDGPLQIGLGHDSVFLLGEIDDLRLYNRGLSECEIKQLHNNTDGSGFTQADIDAADQQGLDDGIATSQCTGTSQPATLSHDLKRHIPLLHFMPVQGDAATVMPLWVDFEPTDLEPLLFKVTEYGIIE